MAKIEFKPTTVRFDSARAALEVRKIARAKLEEAAEKLTDIIKAEIDKNGNGSHVMRDEAKSAVKKVLEKFTNEIVEYDVGIKEEDLSGMTENFFIAVMVVLHGNQTHGPIWTKPGSPTYGKNVTGPRIYTMRNGKYPKLRALPFFDQKNDAAKPIIANAMQQIEPILNDCIRAIGDAISGGFFMQFIHAG